MNSIRWMICCWVALGVVVYSPLRAQDLDLEVADVVQVEPAHEHDHDHDHVHPQLVDHNQQVRERQKESFKRHLAVRITDLKRVCELEEKQVKKLEVASKGAVEEAMKQFLQRFPQLKDQAQRQQFQPQLNAQPLHALAIAKPIQRAVAELRVAVEQADVVEAQVDVEPLLDEPAPLPAAGGEAPPPVADVFVAPRLAAPAIWNVHQNFQMEASEAANTVVWRNAVKRVLTEEQTAAHRKSQIDRRLFKRQTIVDRVVASVDRRLFLSDKQRKDLAKVIHDALGENLDNMVPHGGFTSDAMVAAQVVGQIPKGKLKGVLDEAQIQSWNDVQHIQHGVVFGVGVR